MKGNTGTMKERREEKGSRAVIAASVTILMALLISTVLIFSSAAPDDDGDQVLGAVDHVEDGIKYTVLTEDLILNTGTMSAGIDVSGEGLADLEIQGTITIAPITYTVTIIRADGFQSCTALEEIVIPSTVTVMGNRAFEECTALKKVDLGGVTDIGQYAFNRCASLTEIDTSSVETFRYASFYGCVGLSSIDFSSATGFGNFAFSHCSGLTSVVIPEGVRETAPYLFDSCTSLTSVTLPSTMEDIRGNTFRNCTALESINTEMVINVYDNAFRNCASLVGPLDLSSVKTIGYMSFYNVRISSVDLSSVETIGREAFNTCTNLTSVSIPASTTFIDIYAFANCASLAAFVVDDANSDYCAVDDILFSKDERTLHVYPPAKEGATYTVSKDVTEIARYAFLGCKNLEAINVEAGNLDYVSVDGVVFTIDMKTLDIYPAGKKDRSYTVQDGILTIAEGAFRMNESLEMIALPASITDIGNRAFQNCRNLVSLNLSNVQVMGDNVFINCDSLKVVTLPDGFVVTSAMMMPADAVLVFVNGDYVTVSATIVGSVVTLDILTPDGFAVKTLKVGTSSGMDDVRGSSASWTFDAGQHKEVYVTLVTGPGYTIIIPPVPGGHFEYRPQGEDIWRDVVNGKVFVPDGWAVELSGVPDEGYEFAWDNAIHREAADPTGKLKISPTSGGTITGTFSLIKENDDDDEDDKAYSSFAALMLVIALLVLLLMILIGFAVKKR
jgi:hypothetical protein